MRKYLFILGLWAPLWLAAQPADSSFAAQFAPVWQRAMAYTLEVAEAMPAQHYAYRPMADQMTFGEHLQHLSRNLYSLSARFIREEAVPALADTSLDKATVIAELKAAFAYATETLAYLDGPAAYAPAPGFWSPDGATKSVVFLLMRDHLTHHRAQMVVYLRLQGITPPRYRGW